VSPAANTSIKASPQTTNMGHSGRIEWVPSQRRAGLAMVRSMPRNFFAGIRVFH